jgi:hypothetical protein
METVFSSHLLHNVRGFLTMKAKPFYKLAKASEDLPF